MRAFLLLLLSLGSAWLQAAEHTWIAPAWTARNTPVVTVDSILLRDTLSRLYITLKQPPHTTLTLHDDWEIQDSLGNFTVRIKDVDGVDFNRIFQFDDDSTVAVEMDFPPLPASCSEFDLIGNKPSGEIRVIGLSLNRQQSPVALSPQPATRPSPPLPVITFEPDTAWLQGRFIGYHRRLNLPAGKIVLTDLLTRQQTTIEVPVADDGTFAVQLPLCHPVQQKLILGDRYIPFYIEPDDTLSLQIPLDELLAPYRNIREIEQNCTHLIYQGRNAQANYELRQIRLQEAETDSNWMQALRTLSPSLYYRSEENKLKVKLERLNRDWQAQKLSSKAYLLSILNNYYLFISHLIVYNTIKNLNTDSEYSRYRKIEIPFATIYPLKEPLSVVSEYYLPFITLLENQANSTTPPDWTSVEFIEALEARNVDLLPEEKEALRLALDGNTAITPQTQAVIQQLNNRCEKEQISMREEKLRQWSEESYRNRFGSPDDFTRQLLDARRVVRLWQSLHRALTIREQSEFTITIIDPPLRFAVKRITSRPDR